MTNRRDWLKYFGVGAVIVPIIGAKADESMAARLIEPPNIKPVELFAKIPKPIDLKYKVASAAVLFTLQDGSTHRIDVNKPNGWGSIDLCASRIDITFQELASPVTTWGSIDGGFRL